MTVVVGTALDGVNDGLALGTMVRIVVGRGLGLPLGILDGYTVGRCEGDLVGNTGAVVIVDAIGVRDGDRVGSTLQ